MGEEDLNEIDQKAINRMMEEAIIPFIKEMQKRGVPPEKIQGAALDVVRVAYELAEKYK